MGKVLLELIDQEIDLIEDAQVKKVCKLLREYSEIQAGTWSQIMDEKTNKDDPADLCNCGNHTHGASTAGWICPIHRQQF